MGKYLNGYAPRKIVDGRRNFVPPGWSEWAGVPTGGDPDFNYTMLVKGLSAPAQTVRYGNRPSAYLTDVLSRRGRQLHRRRREGGPAVHAQALPVRAALPRTRRRRATRSDSPICRRRAEPLFDAPQLEGSPVWLTPRRLARWQIDDIDARLPQARPVGARRSTA